MFILQLFIVATGKTGRFTLIERWRNNSRLLAPQESPLKVNNFML
jgi:Ras association domain-containing protein 7/8